MLPLLGILAGAALGQDWYNQRGRDEARAKVSGLMGTEPGREAFQGEGPPSPGTGLLADPANPAKQAEFMSGIMSLRPRDREVAGRLFGDIMARASQTSLTREGWNFQAQQAAIQEQNIDRRWRETESAVDNRFNQGHALNLDNFQEHKRQYGEQEAWKKLQEEQRKLEAERDYQLRRASDARDAARLALQRAQGGGDGGVKLGVNMRAVVVPGANGQPEIVAAPVPGSPDWVKAQEGVDQVSILKQNLAEYSKSITESGFSKTGAAAGKQKQLWSRIVGALGGIDHLGTLQKSDLERIAGEMPDVTEVLSLPNSRNFVQSQLQGLSTQADKEIENAKYKYRGWGVRLPEVGAPAEAGGQAKPPAGSVPFGARAPRGSPVQQFRNQTLMGGPDG